MADTTSLHNGAGQPMAYAYNGYTGESIAGYLQEEGLRLHRREISHPSFQNLLLIDCGLRQLDYCCLFVVFSLTQMQTAGMLAFSCWIAELH